MRCIVGMNEESRPASHFVNLVMTQTLSEQPEGHPAGLCLGPVINGSDRWPGFSRK